jgi:hypothetical protein
MDHPRCQNARGQAGALEPFWRKRAGKPVLIEHAIYKSVEIPTPDGHWEFEWYEVESGNAALLGARDCGGMLGNTL